MAERFKRTYISAWEFVNSWEKEIYELNNLDYFIFLMMNDLGSLVEKDFFEKSDRKEPLFLNGHEIGNLVFNLGDSLQLFFEKNCFGSCTLRCPSRLNESLENADHESRKKIFHEFDTRIASCRTKEQCFYLDIMNYVVLDTLIDFYNYEMDVIFDESDLRLMRLAEFIMEIIVDFTRKKGRQLLDTPQENAGDRFKDSMQADETPWTENLPEMDEEEEEDIDFWKTGTNSIKRILNDFREENEHTYPDGELYFVDKFEEYATDFLEVKTIDEIDVQDIEEFFLVILLNELTDHESSMTDRIMDVFEHLFNYIEFRHEFDIKYIYEQSSVDINAIKRVTGINRSYRHEHPLLAYLLSPDSSNETIIEGFFELETMSTDMLVLRDVHLSTRFKPVHPGPVKNLSLHVGDVLHVQIIVMGTGWQISHLEMLYPGQSKPYLF